MIKKLLSIVIITIIVAGVSIPIINGTYIDYSQYSDNGWYYDDYKEIDNVESVSGSLETVTFSGTTYIHADSVGDGTITYTDGTTETVTVEKANLDVFVALGQSNNAYVNYDAATAICPDIGTAYYYGTTSKLTTGTDYESVFTIHPMVNTPGTSVIGDKAPAFCKEYYDHSNHKVYYIDGAWSGSSILQWQPDAGMYNAAAATVENAMSVVDTSLFNVSIKGYTWIQGESDEDMTADEYYDYFVIMHDAILAGGLSIDLDHCFISKVREIYEGPAEAQILLASNLDTVTLSTEIVDTFTVANGLMGSDDVHYSQAGDNLVGAALGDSATFYYYPWTYEDTPYSSFVVVVPVILIVALLAISIRWLFNEETD